MQKYNYEEIKKYIEIDSNSSCKLLSTEYIDAKHNLIFLCKCGNKFETSFTNFKSVNKRQCNQCGYKRIGKILKYSIDDIKKYIETNSNCKLLSNHYENVKTKLKIQCGCGNIFYRTFDCFKSKPSKCCNICCIKKRSEKEKLTNSEVRTILLENGYDLIEKFENVNLPIIVKDCDGYIYKSYLYNFTNRGTARKFAQTNPFTLQNLNLWIQLNHKKFKLLSDQYIGSRNKTLEFKCLQCGFIWKASCNNILRGSGCPQCSQSKGEIDIENYLKLQSINYIPQKEFDGLLGLGNGNLSYDFYLPDYNLLIEYQGQQHEHYIKGLHLNKAAFKQQQEHDKRKKDYANIHNIKLLEIWYYDFDNIKQILNENLNIN